MVACVYASGRGVEEAEKLADEEGGGTYIFEPMRLDLYEKCVKDRLANGKDFDNLDSLINAFLNTTTI